MWRGVVGAQQQSVYNLDVRLNNVARSMSATGIYVNRAKQRELAAKYQLRANAKRIEFAEACGRNVNPRSFPQVRDFIYEDLGLPVLDGKEYETKTGDPSTNEETLIALLALGLDQRATRVIHSLLLFRAADKVLGTYTGRFDADGNFDEDSGPPIDEDGRLRTGWNVNQACTGRWSSSDPFNLTNVPDDIRAMYAPAPGHVLVARDYSALEMRIAALLSGDETLIEAFRLFDAGQGPDVHTAIGCRIFRCDPSAINKRIRVLTKRVEFGTNYGQEPPGTFAQIRMEYDDEFRPRFPDIDLAEVERVHRAYKELFPKVHEWLAEQPRVWRKQGYLASPWHGRRRYFIGGEDKRPMFNFPIQSGAADIENEAVIALVEEVPFDLQARTGLVLQVHDQLCVEVPATDECIAQATRGLRRGDVRVGPVNFPGDVKTSAVSWKEVS